MAFTTICIYIYIYIDITYEFVKNSYIIIAFLRSNLLLLDLNYLTFNLYKNSS